MLIELEVANREEKITKLKEKIESTKKSWYEVRDRMTSADALTRLEKQEEANALMGWMKELKAQIAVLEGEILALEMGEMMIARPSPEEMLIELQKIWLQDEVLHLIDYNDAKDDFERIFNAIQHKDFGALIVVQHCIDYKGSLFWQHIEKIYRNAGGGSPISIAFRRSEPFTAQSFIDKLSTYLASEELAKLAFEDKPRFIASQFLKQADFGRTVAIRIDCTTIEPDAFDWFLNTFWKIVREELNTDQYFGAKIVVVFFIEDALNVPAPQMLCAPTAFDAQHPCEIQLSKWEETHIKGWFMQHHVLQPLKQWQIEKEVIMRIMIYLTDECSRVEGVPDRFYGRLLSEVIKRIVHEELAV